MRIFLFKYIDGMKVLGDVWKCVLVTSNNSDNGILAMNNGYSHPFFTALLSKGIDKNK